MRWNLMLVVLALCLLFPTLSWSQVPDIDQVLESGELAKGQAVLEKHLAQNPADDRVRLGLGMVQFLRAYEGIGGSLYRFGLRTERSFLRPNRQIVELWPQNPNPEKIDFQAARQIIQTFVDDMNRAEATLSLIKDDKVKLPIHIARVKFDFFGLQRPVSAGMLFGQFGAPNLPADQIESFVIAFDRGDVAWLRGYCHFLAAVGEILLAVDSQPLFECSAHWVFENVETPHSFLIDDRESIDMNTLSWLSERTISDIIATIHLSLRFSVKEPERLRTAHEHLRSMCQMSRQMWTHFQAETDDDNEWIPNPKQTGVLGVPVTADMITTWLETVSEAERVLNGERLVPFWRGVDMRQGVNVKRVFFESEEIDIPLWVQGTAATPYLEDGKLTQFIEPQMIRRIDRQFGGFNFIGFGFWFN